MTRRALDVYKRQVTSSFENAFGVPPIYTTIILVAVAAVIVLRKMCIRDRSTKNLKR